MEIKDIITKLNGEAWKHTPDLREKIVKNAQLSGKLKATSSGAGSSGSSGSSGGGTATGIKIGAVVLSAIVAAGVGIGVPVALSGNGGPVKRAPHEHAFGEWEIVLPANCTQNGQKQRICECGETQTNVIPAAHKYAELLYDDEMHWAVCSVCGTEGEAAEHDYNLSGECAECANALVITEGLTFELNEDGQSYMVTTGPVGIVNLVIPAEYNGYPVTKINGQAFCNRSELLTVAIPATITYIDQQAFAHNVNLKSITIYGSTPHTFSARATVAGSVIAENAFDGSYSLEKIDLPQGLVSVGAYAFNYCRSLKTIDIPDSVSEIGERAFCGAEALKSVKLPKSLKKLSYCMFEACYGLEEVIFNDGLEVIEDSLFGGCPIKYLHIPASVKEISEIAFSGINRDNITEVTVDAPNYKLEGNCFIEIDSGTLMFAFNNPVIPADGLIKKIAAYAFSGHKTISSIVIPDGVTELGIGAFGYSALTSIVIPEGVTELPMSVFARCEQLTTVRLPSTVTSIAYLAFSRCSGLSAVYYNGTISQFNAITKESGWKSSPASIPVKFTLVDKNGNTAAIS